MWSSCHIITGEKLQSLSDVYLGKQEDFEFNPFIRSQTDKHLELDMIPSDYDNPGCIFVYGHRIREFAQHIEKLRNPFTLITHNSDENIVECDEFLKILRYPRLQKWFAQNVCFDSEKLTALPIGIANSMWPHGRPEWFKNNKLSKTKDVYFSFNLGTNGSKRTECYETLKPKLTFLPVVPPEENISRMKDYKFCICPEGNGVDTHRFWEALYLRTVPIVIDSPAIRLLTRNTRIPVIILNSWSDFNPAVLKYNFDGECLSDISFETHRRRICQTTPVTVVLTCLVNFQEYILDAIQNLLVHGNERIVVITEPGFFSRFSKFPMVDLVDAASLQDEFNFSTRTTLNQDYRNGFWRLASARFFVLYSYLKKHNLHNCLHIENDNVVYANVDSIPWNPTRMAGAYDGSGRMIPSVVWIPKPELLYNVLRAYDFSANDMVNFGRVGLEHLPIFPDSWTVGSEPFVVNTEQITENYPLYSYIFDAAAMGQYLGGLDPYVFGYVEPRTYVSPDCLIKYNYYEFKWTNGCPSLRVSGRDYRIFNLHIHSKKLEDFASS